MEYGTNVSERTNQVIIEEMQRRRSSVQSEIAQLALRGETLYDKIEARERQEDLLLPVHVFADSYTYHDEGYIGGYTGSGKGVDARLNCGDLSLAYMYTLARFPGSLGAQSGESLDRSLQSDIRREKWYDYTDVSLVHVILDESWERPTEPIQTLWHDAKALGRQRMADLLDEVIATNPYQDIPIKINKSDLYDAMLRQKILAMCDASTLLEVRDDTKTENEV